MLFRAPSELYSPTNAHYGSRSSSHQGHLFYSLGEKNQIANAQDLSSPLGKIHRVNDDGSVPKDNPFVNRPGAVPTIWSYGHRNPQGLSWDPVSGKLWESEHGPQGGDEINIIEPGRNYGWGVITSGIQGGVAKRAEEGMQQPIVHYTPSIGPSVNHLLHTGTRYPGGRTISSSRGSSASSSGVSKSAAASHPSGGPLQPVRSVHDVIQGPDGYLYVTFQVPGQSMSASTPGMGRCLVPQP